jgi:hypothetical protein
LLQWIIIGVACYLVNKIERNKYLPKYHLGMLSLQKAQTREVTPELIVYQSKAAELVLIVITTVLAPLALIGCFFMLLSSGPSEGILKMRACCDEFAKTHGIVF